ncbi:TIGR01459 family HAD-type hydrolase [Aestuariibius insulae]|uniref:TIGR01459 family HAD-type hydrolase n=1 Tax=Aestuariibius insulae TaxID=2058287 RepID=UPI00345EC1EC
MTRLIRSLSEITDQIDAIVLDQWGVLHDGSAPYLGVPDALAKLDLPLAVLSNSGKRADLNAARMEAMGYPPALFMAVMTSGEALWQDFEAGRIEAEKVLAITGSDGDAERWAEGLRLTLTDRVEEADAVLLMGLPEDGATIAQQRKIDKARQSGLTLYCSNPDRGSPRADGRIVPSPGAVAHDYRERGGEVVFYGKPHRPVYSALERVLDCPPRRILMVGDSLEHDIAGATGAGWQSALVLGGLHAASFRSDDPLGDLDLLVAESGYPPPDYMIEVVA